MISIGSIIYLKEKGVRKIMNKKHINWMYLDEPYDESEETPDATLIRDQDGNIITLSERRD
jgi:hypothetical protein